MKLIDKYLLRSLVVPLLYCLAAFTLVYVIYDLFDNLPDFVRGGAAIASVGIYYVLLIPSVLIIIVPISLLLAGLYTLSSLTKNNELTAMRASGVSIYRLVVPFIGVGLLASITVAIVHETIGPWSAYWTEQFVRFNRHRHEFNVYIAHDVGYVNPHHRRTWFVKSFDLNTFDMEGIEVTQQRPDLSDAAKIQARRAEWLDGRWWFIQVVTQSYDREGRPVGAPEIERMREMGDFTETPEDFINARKDIRNHPEQFSSREYLEYLQVHPNLSQETTARIKTDMHYRLAMPWTCVIVMLLGIPFGVQTGRKGPFLGVLLSLSLFFGFYFLIHFGLALGKTQAIDPWLGAWTPNMFFLLLGCALMYRMR